MEKKFGMPLSDPDNLINYMDMEKLSLPPSIIKKNYLNISMFGINNIYLPPGVPSINYSHGPMFGQESVVKSKKLKSK